MAQVPARRANWGRRTLNKAIRTIEILLHYHDVRLLWPQNQRGIGVSASMAASTRCSPASPSLREFLDRPPASQARYGKRLRSSINGRLPEHSMNSAIACNDCSRPARNFAVTRIGYRPGVRCRRGWCAPADASAAPAGPRLQDRAARRLLERCAEDLFVERRMRLPRLRGNQTSVTHSLLVHKDAASLLRFQANVLVAGHLPAARQAAAMICTP